MFPIMNQKRPAEVSRMDFSPVFVLFPANTEAHTQHLVPLYCISMETEILQPQKMAPDLSMAIQDLYTSYDLEKLRCKHLLRRIQDTSLKREKKSLGFAQKKKRFLQEWRHCKEGCFFLLCSFQFSTRK